MYNIINVEQVNNRLIITNELSDCKPDKKYMDKYNRRMIENFITEERFLKCYEDEICEIAGYQYPVYKALRLVSIWDYDTEYYAFKNLLVSRIMSQADKLLYYPPDTQGYILIVHDDTLEVRTGINCSFYYKFTELVA